MAMIECPECQKRVSDKAATCPDCGCPVAPAVVQTIEQTGKRYKGAQVIGICLSVLGAFIGCVTLSGSEPSPDGIVPGLIVFVIGIAICIFAKIGAWWHHG